MILCRQQRNEQTGLNLSVMTPHAFTVDLGYNFITSHNWTNAKLNVSTLDDFCPSSCRGSCLSPRGCCPPPWVHRGEGETRSEEARSRDHHSLRVYDRVGCDDESVKSSKCPDEDDLLIYISMLAGWFIVLSSSLAEHKPRLWCRMEGIMEYRPYLYWITLFDFIAFCLTCDLAEADRANRSFPMRLKLVCYLMRSGYVLWTIMELPFHAFRKLERRSTKQQPPGVGKMDIVDTVARWTVTFFLVAALTSLASANMNRFSNCETKDYSFNEDMTMLESVIVNHCTLAGTPRPTGRHPPSALDHAHTALLATLAAFVSRFVAQVMGAKWLIGNKLKGLLLLLAPAGNSRETLAYCVSYIELGSTLYALLSAHHDEGFIFWEGTTFWIMSDVLLYLFQWYRSERCTLRDAAR